MVEWWCNVSKIDSIQFAIIAAIRGIDVASCENVFSIDFKNTQTEKCMHKHTERVESIAKSKFH